MSIQESHDLYRNAHEFFSKLTLMDENKQPVGKLYFKDALGKEAKVQIDIKALDQNERALLHFSITRELPKDFSLIKLKKALDGLEKKTFKSENIFYEQTRLSSISKKIKHSFEKNVIGADDLSTIIQKKDEEVKQLWARVKEVIEPLVEEDFLKLLETRFPHFLSRLNATDYKALISVNLKETYNQIYNQAVDAFRTDKGEYEIRGQLNDSLKTFDFIPGSFNDEIRDAIKKSAFKEAYAMDRSQAMQRFNETKTPLFRYDKADNKFYLCFKNEFGAASEWPLASDYDQKELYQYGSKRIIDKLKETIKDGPFGGHKFGLYSSFSLSTKTLKDRLQFVSDWIATKDNLNRVPPENLGTLYDFISRGEDAFGTYNTQTIRGMKNEVIKIDDEKSRDLLNELVNRISQRAEYWQSKENEYADRSSAAETNVVEVLRQLTPAATPVERLKQVFELPGQKIETVQGYNQNEAKAIVKFICGTEHRDEIIKQRKAIILQLHTDKTEGKASDLLTAWNALWQNADMTKRP